MKRTVITITIIIFLMSSWYTISPISAEASRVPGVAGGNWAKYDVAFNYSTNDPTPPMIPPPLEEIEYYRLNIQSVTNTNITYQTIMHFKNGTEMSVFGWLDVSSGQTNYGFTGFGPLVAANLTAGDEIYLNSFSFTINATSLGTYAGAQREINCFYMNQNLSYPYSPQRTLVNYSVFWDKMSGIFVLMDESVVLIDNVKGYTTNMTVSLIIRETNIWSLVPAVEVEVFIAPRFINLKSKGKWLLAFVELPKGYKAKDIDLSTIVMNGTIQAEGKAMITGKRWLLVRFNRSEVISLILSSIHSKAKFMIIILTITGKFSDGSMFQGSDKVVAMLPPFRHCKSPRLWLQNQFTQKNALSR